MLKNVISFVKANRKVIVEKTLIGAGVVVGMVLATALTDDEATNNEEPIELVEVETEVLETETEEE